MVGAGASPGNRTKWNLSRGVERSMGKVGAGGSRGDAAAPTLWAAVSSGKHPDVVFELDDGTKIVGGYKEILSTASEEFHCMFHSGMREEHDGVVRVHGIGASAVKGFLEWVYLGEWMFVRTARGLFLRQE